ncbi:ZIP zinc/iron transport family [Basidiobolus meristosporus CBS 931.73]|uniref:ZIP zinc/iron transport family n=1 Tax=Basidiobolus meristosporus CBS 931.73 TaxID=1314790 RepID=A0A1Y1YQG4_9FUNG|nr:ZIP zinc/iron transport family [Basidiobolus meristosporus CBS 931.73]|eukprot:ORX99986.1 ZIP zinc/iron transport family [Basidiobolus meristosporus CBS 931.73]
MPIARFNSLLALSVLVLFVTTTLAQTTTIAPKHAGPSHGDHDHDHEDSEACAAEEIVNYQMPLHIASIFIIMITSALGVFSSLILSRFPAHKVTSSVINIGKYFGTGVILATGFIHMFPGALFALTNPCVPKAISANYTSFAGLFAMFAALMLQAIEYIARWYYSQHATNQEHLHGHVTTAEAKEDTCDVTDHCHAHGGLIDIENRRVSTYILELGIALHSVLIGISVGVASGSEFIPLLIAVVFHQFFEGLALGARIGELPYTNRMIPYLSALFYTVITPIGVAIGVGIHETYNANSATNLLVNGIFDSISAGILIYMALVNLIAPDFQNNPKFMSERGSMKLVYYIAMWLGAGIMALIGLWA